MPHKQLVAGSSPAGPTIKGILTMTKADCLGMCKRKQVPINTPGELCPYCGGLLSHVASATLPVSVELSVIADESSQSRQKELKMESAIDYHLKVELPAREV